MSSRMKKALSYILLLMLTVACGSGGDMQEYTIKGDGVGEGTIYLFAHDNTHKELLSTRSDGSFTLSTPLDRATAMTLILPNSRTVTLFAEPGLTATLHPDTTLQSGWSVAGGKEQVLYDSISRILDATTDFESQKRTIEGFTQKYPTSIVVAELFRNYLVDIPEPDNEYLRRAIQKLGGVLQDHEYFYNLKKRLDKKGGEIKHRMFPTFKYTTIDSKEVTPGTYSDRYLLVTFWATWDADSREGLKKLKEVQKGIRSKNLAILNIALDCDTALLRRAIENDTIIGDNAYDNKGMNSEITEMFNISSLPYSVLVTPYKRISEYDLQLDSVSIALIDSLTYRHDNKTQKR